MQLAGRRPLALTYASRSLRNHRLTVHVSSAASIEAGSEAADTGSDQAVSKPDKFAAVGSCKDCNGLGSLPQGGYHKKNPLNPAKLLGSKWTAREPVLGWRHFVVTERRKTDDSMYAYLIATCDTEVGIWINVTNLRDRAMWACGWLQKVQLQQLDNPEFRTCKTCGGSGLSKGYFKA